jgi:hypothetical protein
VYQPQPNLITGGKLTGPMLAVIMMLVVLLGLHQVFMYFHQKLITFTELDNNRW